MTADSGSAAADASTSESLDLWLARLAGAGGAPGGGAACGVMLAVSAALAEMVARYTRDDPRAEDAAARVRDVRARALQAAEADAVQSAALGRALAEPTHTPGRDRSVRDAALAAAESSAALGGLGIELVAELSLLADIGNPHVRADLAVAAHALAAGIAGARVNLDADLQLADGHGNEGDRKSEPERLLAAASSALRDAREAASVLAEAAGAG